MGRSSHFKAAQAMSKTLNITDLARNSHFEKKTSYFLDNLYGYPYILLRPGSSEVDRGLKSKLAGRGYGSRIMLRFGGSSPHVLIVVDVIDIRNIQFA